MSLAIDTIDFCWGPTYVEGCSHAIRSLLVRFSFATPQGLSLWTAKAARWSLQNQVKHHAAIASHEHLLSQWMQILTQIVAWEPLQHVTKSLLSFHGSLASLS